MTLNVDQLSQTLSPENPCGPDLSYDPLFGELERAAQGKPEQQFGDTLIPAEPPQWNIVRDKALTLCQRTKDLRVLLYLVEAELNTSGWAGYAEAIEAVARITQEHWDHIHPELDPDDGRDPTSRFNTLRTLVAPAALQGLRSAPLVHSRRLGIFSYRDVQIASGQVSAPEDTEQDLPNIATIEAAFLDSDSDDFERTLAAPARAVLALSELETFLDSKAGDSGAVPPNFSPLRSILESVNSTLEQQAERRGISTGEAPAPTAVNEEDPVPPAATASVPRGIQRREDVIRMLDEICDYFRRQEPSSPVPLLLQRAKNLVSKDFMEILRDLTPDAIGQAELFRGSSSDSS